jgi:TrmH family RNA methyltransferase
MKASPPPPPPLLVLVEPQDLVNIAAAVRVAKNFGIERVRLVSPREYDPWRIEGIAHQTADMLERLVVTDTLDAALADCRYAVALTARQRRARRTQLWPRAAAAELVARAAEGPVAMVFGREDKGLSNAQLDRCHALVTIPTVPHYRSLNLAQAVALMCWECWLARCGEAAPIKPPRRQAEAATGELLERLFADWAAMLEAIDFFKTRQPELVMRSVREVVFRAGLDAREATLLRAMALEVVRYLERRLRADGRGGALEQPEHTKPLDP